MFCSSFVVGFWKTLIKDILDKKNAGKQVVQSEIRLSDDQASGDDGQRNQQRVQRRQLSKEQEQEQEQNMITDMKRFIQMVEPMNCTPTDLKYFIRYFPNLFEFSESLADIRRGAILKTNFMGPPRYGHAMIALSDSTLFKDSETDLMFSKVEVGSFAKGFQKFEMLFPIYAGNYDKNVTSLSMSTYIIPNYVERHGFFHMYVMNPNKNLMKIMRGHWNKTLTKVNRTTMSYSKTGAVSSAFKPCFRDRELFLSYLRQRITGQIAKNARTFRHYYIR